MVEYCLIGIRKCGCTVAIMLKPYDKDTIIEWIAEGYDIKHTNLKNGKKMLKSCTCEAKQ